MPGKSSLTSRLGASPASIARAVVAQMKAAGAPPAGVLDGPDVHALAAMGTSGTGGPLPYLDQIQRAFGHHDVSGVRAHVGGVAADAASGMGAVGYAVADDVAFGSAPDLHLAAHEAAHVVQQRRGVQLSRGVGTEGDEYERHADAVADGVSRGEFVQDLLDGLSHRGPSGGAAVQRQVPPAQTGAQPAGPQRSAYDLVRECREQERADAAGEAPTEIPSSITRKEMQITQMASLLAASFRDHLDSTHTVPGDPEIRSTLQSYLASHEDFGEPISFTLRGDTGFNDGRDDSEYHCILRFRPSAPAVLNYAVNGADSSGRASTQSTAESSGGGLGVSVPPVAGSVGSASSSGNSQANSNTHNRSEGIQIWRMNLNCDLSWERRDAWGDAHSSGWQYVPVRPCGHVIFERPGPMSPCPTLAQQIPSPAPALIAPPAAVTAPAIPLPANNTTYGATDTTSNTTATSTAITTSTATNTNNNNNATIPPPTPAPAPAPTPGRGGRRRNP